MMDSLNLLSKGDTSLGLLWLDHPDSVRLGPGEWCGVVLYPVLVLWSPRELLLSEHSTPLPEAQCVAKRCRDTAIQCHQTKFMGPNCMVGIMCHKLWREKNVTLPMTWHLTTET